MKRTWVIVPMYNEAAVVGAVVERLLEQFSHVVCVDDGSTDGSSARANAAGALVIHHPINLGQGAALQTGIEYTLQDPEMQYVVTFDADGQHRVSDAVAMVARLNADEADVVLGTRFLDDRTELGRSRRLILKAAALQTRMTTGMQLTDAHNGIRAFNRSVAQRIDLTQNRMAHASELIHQIAKMDVRYVEQAVEIVYTDYSRAKGQPLLNSLNILAELLFK